MNQPLVSLIVPVYYTKVDELERMAQSVAAQTYQNIEVLLVDDGCDADYAAQIDCIAQADERFRVLHREHGGVSAARNAGIEEARGEFIMFVDADDELAPAAVENALELAISHDLDMVCGGALYKYPSHEKSSKLHFEDGEELHILEGDDLLLLADHFFSHNTLTAKPELRGLPRGPWGKLIRREALENVRFDPALRICEDVVFNAFVTLNARRVGLTDDVWYSYYQNSSTAMGRLGFDEQFDEYAVAVEKIVTQEGLPRDWYRALIFFYFFEALKREALRDNPNRRALIKEWLRKPYCEEMFCSLDVNRLSVNRRRRFALWLCRRKAAGALDMLYTGKHTTKKGK